jgi:hypothetical protein
MLLAMTSLVDRLLPDELWQRIQPLLPAPPPRPRGGVPRQVPDRNCVARSSSWPVPRPRGACSRPRSWARPAASIWSESASTPSACGRSQGDLTGAIPPGVDAAAQPRSMPTRPTIIAAAGATCGGGGHQAADRSAYGRVLGPGLAATAGRSNEPGPGWADGGGCRSATSAPPNTCMPWPCWPGR